MTTQASVFANGLINAFRSEHARNVIVAPLTKDAGWSRMFTGYRPDPNVTKALYDQLFKAAGKRALDIEMEDEKGQRQISIKIKKALRLFTEEIIDAFLTNDRSDLKPEIKAAIGDKYDEVKKIMGEDQIIKDLVTAAIAVYAEVLSDEFYLRCGVRPAAGSDPGEILTEEQNRLNQNFNFNISNKINEYLRSLTIDDLKKPVAHIKTSPFLLYIVSVTTQSIEWLAGNASFLFGFFNQVTHDKKQVEMTQIYEELPQNDPDVLSNTQETDKLYKHPTLESSLNKIDLAISDAIEGLMVYKDMLSQSGSADAIYALDKVQTSINSLQKEQTILRTSVENISNQNFKETIAQSEIRLTNIKMALSAITERTEVQPRGLFNVSYLIDCVREFIAGVPTHNVMTFLEKDKNQLIKSMDKMKAELGKMRAADEPENYHHLDMEE